MPGGRPSQFSEEHIRLAQEYIDTWKELGDEVPQLAGLAEHCGICKDTRLKYEKVSEEFAVLCARVRLMQEKALINKGLARKADSSLCKLLLMKHGYTDRQQVDHQSSDGTMSPTKIEIVAPKEK